MCLDVCFVKRKGRGNGSRVSLVDFMKEVKMSLVKLQGVCRRSSGCMYGKCAGL